MSTINLLPWREAKRKELQAQFITALVSVAVLALIVWGAGHYYHTQLIEVQNTRVAYVEDNIKIVVTYASYRTIAGKSTTHRAAI
jgi:type IV pilus assembly protein PilN